MAKLVTMYGSDGKSVKVYPVDVPELLASGYTKEPQAVKRVEAVETVVEAEIQEEVQSEAPKRGRKARVIEEDPEE